MPRPNTMRNSTKTNATPIRRHTAAKTKASVRFSPKTLRKDMYSLLSVRRQTHQITMEVKAQGRKVNAWLTLSRHVGGLRDHAGMGKAAVAYCSGRELPAIR